MQKRDSERHRVADHNTISCREVMIGSAAELTGKYVNSITVKGVNAPLTQYNKQTLPYTRLQSATR